MEHNDLINIANSSSRINELISLNNELLDHIKLSPAPEQIPTRLEVNGDVIEANCFNYRATAKPRVVKSGKGIFSTEYIFKIGQEEEAVEVWRCYLDSYGTISEDLEGEIKVCDFNNRYIASNICGRLLKGTLNSVIFNPAP